MRGESELEAIRALNTALPFADFIALVPAEEAKRGFSVPPELTERWEPGTVWFLPAGTFDPFGPTMRDLERATTVSGFKVQFAGEWPAAFCLHCDMEIRFTAGKWAHYTAPDGWLIRCQHPDVPYGAEAEPAA